MKIKFGSNFTMKKRSIIKLTASLFVCCAMLGCGKEDNPTSKLGLIYGTVTDFATGDPVSNANVRLNPRGETTLTGSDGTFQFNDVEDGRYSLSLSKNGYVDLDDDYVIEIENGNNVRRDVQLRSQYESFKVTINGIETDTIYLEEGNYTSTFLVTNDGTIVIRVSGLATTNGLYFKRGGYYYQDFSYVIEPNKGYPYVVYILEGFPGVGYIYLNSNQISKTLVFIRR